MGRRDDGEVGTRGDETRGDETTREKKRSREGDEMTRHETDETRRRRADVGTTRQRVNVGRADVDE
jgi:hypothetical protein